MTVGPDEVATAAFRDERVAVLATLIRHVGDFQLAEDAVQDAFAAAVGAWRRDGVPDNPAAWITVAARRRAIDLVRRGRAQADRAERLAELIRMDGDTHPAEPAAVPDDRLRLIFTACHPALDLPARVALTLRVVGGLTTAEIARAFLVAEPTMGKRIVRAKKKIAAAGIPYRVPSEADLPARLRGVLRVVYLIFNEGYLGSAGDRLVRAELCAEAVRLGRLLADVLPAEPEVWGLLALMLLHDARRASRVDGSGAWVGLPGQDTARWDGDSLAAGLSALDRGLRLGPAGEYLLQAAITALQMRGADTGETDWPAIAHLYARLAALTRSPVVAVNHAAAVGFTGGPEAGLSALTPLLDDPALGSYQPLYATHADLLRRTGATGAARAAYGRAIELSTNPVERAELERRRDRLG